MLTEVTSKISNKHWDLYTSDQINRFNIQLILAFTSIAFFNPLTLSFLGNALGFDVEKGGALSISIFLFTTMLLIAINSLVWIRWSGLYSDKGTGSRRVTLDVVSIKNVSNLKSHARKLFSTQSVLTNFAGTDIYNIDRTLFTSTTRTRYLLLLVSAVIVNTPLWFLSESTRIVSLFTLPLLVMVGALIIDYFYTIVCRLIFLKRHQYLFLSNQNDDANRDFCNYQLQVSCNENDFHRQRIIVADIDIWQFYMDNTSSYSSIIKAISAIKSLYRETYTVMALINTQNQNTLASSMKEQNKKHIQRCEFLFAHYIPECVSHLKLNFGAKMSDVEKIKADNYSYSIMSNLGSGIGLHGNKQSLASAWRSLTKTETSKDRSHNPIDDAYSSLTADILKQGQVVDEIHEYYKSLTANSVSSGIQHFIENQNHRLTIGSENNYSPKIKTLNHSINKEIIPELEKLMVHANHDETVKIKAQIKELNDLFQSKLQAEQIPTPQIALIINNTDPLSLNSVNNLSQTPIESYLNQVSYYVDELKQHW